MFVHVSLSSSSTHFSYCGWQKKGPLTFACKSKNFDRQDWYIYYHIDSVKLFTFQCPEKDSNIFVAQILWSPCIGSPDSQTGVT